MKQNLLTLYRQFWSPRLV